jgi:predicted nucleic acid-binding Zn ribbon protein
MPKPQKVKYEVECINCSNHFPAKNNRAKFCSDKCRMQFNRRPKNVYKTYSTIFGPNTFEKLFWIIFGPFVFPFILISLFILDFNHIRIEVNYNAEEEEQGDE